METRSAAARKRVLRKPPASIQPPPSPPPLSPLAPLKKEKSPINLVKKFFKNSIIKNGKRKLLKKNKQKNNKKNNKDIYWIDFLDYKDDENEYDEDDDDDEDDDYDEDETDSKDKDDDDESFDFAASIEKELKYDNFETYSRLMEKLTNQGQEKKFFMKQDLDTQKEWIDRVKQIIKIGKQSTPLPSSVSVINSTTIPEKYKYLVLNKIKTMEMMEQEANGEYFKLKQWIDMFLKIPFLLYNTLPCTCETSTKEECSDFLQEAQKTLDKAVYGMKDAKDQFMQMLAQWMSNPQSQGNAIALYGPPGIGKTSLVKEGISKILNRPFAFIPLGGSTDVSYFTGHSYTFEGSIPGRIANIVMETQTMSPVFYFDELDKISPTSEHGQDVIAMLMHLIDGSQNQHFHDRYFAGIDFDLSKALFIFSYNDDTKVHPVLKDRMYRIECSGYSRSEKIEIAKNFLIPAIKKNVLGDKETLDPLELSDNILGHIIDVYTEGEKGVRNLKRCLETVYKKVNLKRLFNIHDNDSFSVDELLKSMVPKTEVYNFYS